MGVLVGDPTSVLVTLGQSKDVALVQGRLLDCTLGGMTVSLYHFAMLHKDIFQKAAKIVGASEAFCILSQDIGGNAYYREMTTYLLKNNCWLIQKSLL